MDIHKAFQLGAKLLAANEAKYTELHKGHGIDQYHWQILTQKEYWSPDQARSMRQVLADVVNVSLTIAGMPALPLPGQYVAAVIAEVVAPPNRMLACTKAPDTFDAAAASGITETHEVKPMHYTQMMALVLAYSGGYGGEPPPHKLPEEVTRVTKASNTKRSEKETLK